MFGRSKRTTQQQKRNEETYEDAIRDFKKKKYHFYQFCLFEQDTRGRGIKKCTLTSQVYVNTSLTPS